MFLFLQYFIYPLSPKSFFTSQEESFFEYLQKNATYFQGNQYSCFDLSELSVVLKILKKANAGFSEEEFIKPFQLVIERIPLEKLMCGEIFPKTIAVRLIEKGIMPANSDVLPDALLQERVIPFNTFFANEFNAIKKSSGEELERHIKIIKNALEGFKKTLEQMASFGIVDTDPVQAFPNYGVTEGGRVVCFDFSHLKPIEEASAFHVLRLLRKALNEFDSYAGAGSPAFKIPIQIYREFSDFMLLEVKYCESTVLNADMKINSQADAFKSYYQIVQDDPAISQVNLLYEKSFLINKAA